MTGQRRGHSNRTAGRGQRQHPPAHMPEVECSTGKVVIRRVNQLDGIASAFARELNAKGQYSQDLYGYRCDVCRHYHLTRMSEWAGKPNLLVHTAAPKELQEWAMPKHQ